MIKDFETYISEGRMGKLIDAARDGDIRKEDVPTEEIVRSYIYKNKDTDYNSYCKNVTIRKENGQYIVDIQGDYVFRKDITELPFRFGEVSGAFSTRFCKELTSIKGCPKTVGKNFVVCDCPNLKELDELPEYVGENFFYDSLVCKCTVDDIRKRCKIKGWIEKNNLIK